MALHEEAIEYPCSDGHPMADKDINRLLMEYAELAIATKFRDDPSVYVSANLLLYYVEGNPKKRVAPDVLFVQGVGAGLRDVYLTWKEGKVPDVVFEFVARASWRMDPEKKRDLYERLGVPEYYVYDPLHRWLDPPLWAYTLEGGRYVTRPVHEGEITSPRLGLRMRVEGQWLRFYDAETGERMLTGLEADEARRSADEARRTAEEARRKAEAAARQESARAAALSEEVERLRRLLPPGDAPQQP